ncbi:MAG: hypothetical protein ABI475_09370 [Methylophilaceae bacterium]
MYESLSALVGRLGTPYARKLAAASIRIAGAFAGARPSPDMLRRIMGLSFPSPLGLAAGFDKHGALYPALAGLGFGFAEIGSVTPRPQTGRSPGLAAVVARLAGYRAPRPIPLGVSISMNLATPFDQMAQDYLDCLAGVWEYADYITLNLGVRAGPDLHLQENRAALYSVFAAVKKEQALLTAASGYRLPIVVKLDQARGDTDALLGCVREFAFDGLLLSGEAPRMNGAHQLAALERVASRLHDEMPVISVGGIRTAWDAQDRLNAGAALLQVYTGLVDSGPWLVQHINRHLGTTSPRGR